MKKRIISIALSVLMLLSMIPAPAFAEGSVSIAVGTVTANAGESVSVPVTISGATNAKFANMVLSFVVPAELTITGATIGTEASAAGMTISDNSNYASGIIIVKGSSTGSSPADGTLLTLSVSVAESATGAMIITAGPRDDDSGNISDYEENDVLCTFTAGSVTVGSAASSTGITLSGAATNDNPVRVGTAKPIKVNVGVGQDFAATEMTITYPSSLVSFDKDSSTLDTATITDNGSGTLTLVDYGENKTAGAANYVLAFTVNATSAATAEFKVTEAGLGTKDAAVKDDLTTVSELGSVSIEIRNALATVTLPNDGLFYADTTSVEVGGTFTFYPEQTTGGYYNYETPTATMVGSENVTVTPTDDGGWQITGVTGNITINAGSRTPKNFGAVTYTGSGAADVTSKTENAVYGSDITFIIPADKAAGTENGYEYTVTAKFEGSESNYTLTDPTVDATTGARTYTIPGTDVKANVTITVTKTTLDANKVTVSIDGDGKADGTYDGAEAAGASIQVDKGTGSATLTVDTTSGLNKGYTYEVKNGEQTLELDGEGKVTIENISENTTITINKTLNVDGVVNSVKVENADGDAVDKNFVALNGNNMWLIQLPNNVGNTETAVYKYNGEQMFWSVDHENYVIVVISETAPDISAEKFALETINTTPTIKSNDWDVNKSGNVDANDAQLIWNMYSNVYQGFDTEAGVTPEKFMLADANHDGILDTKDAVVIIDKILSGTANETT